jgi:YD repeat-containing protein
LVLLITCILSPPGQSEGIREDGIVTAYTYDLAGRLSTRLLPNGIKTTWTFDARDRITRLEHYNVNRSSLWRLTITGTPVIVLSTRHNQRATPDYQA